MFKKIKYIFGAMLFVCSCFSSSIEVKYPNPKNPKELKTIIASAIQLSGNELTLDKCEKKALELVVRQILKAKQDSKEIELSYTTAPYFDEETGLKTYRTFIPISLTEENYKFTIKNPNPKYLPMYVYVDGTLTGTEDAYMNERLTELFDRHDLSKYFDKRKYLTEIKQYQHDPQKQTEVYHKRIILDKEDNTENEEHNSKIYEKKYMIQYWRRVEGVCQVALWKKMGSLYDLDEIKAERQLDAFRSNIQWFVPKELGGLSVGYKILRDPSLIPPYNSPYAKLIYKSFGPIAWKVYQSKGAESLRNLLQYFLIDMGIEHRTDDSLDDMIFRIPNKSLRNYLSSVTRLNNEPFNYISDNIDYTNFLPIASKVYETQGGNSLAKLLHYFLIHMNIRHKKDDWLQDLIKAIPDELLRKSLIFMVDSDDDIDRSLSYCLEAYKNDGIIGLKNALKDTFAYYELPNPYTDADSTLDAVLAKIPNKYSREQLRDKTNTGPSLLRAKSL